MEINDKRRHEVAENLRRQLRYMRENDDYEKDVDVTECGNTAYRNIAWAVEPYGNSKKRQLRPYRRASSRSNRPSNMPKNHTKRDGRSCVLLQLRSGNRRVQRTELLSQLR